MELPGDAETGLRAMERPVDAKSEKLVPGFLVGLGCVVPFAFGSILAIATSWLVRRGAVEAGS